MKRHILKINRYCFRSRIECSSCDFTARGDDKNLRRLLEIEHNQDLIIRQIINLKRTLGDRK